MKTVLEAFVKEKTKGLKTITIMRLQSLGIVFKNL